MQAQDDSFTLLSHVRNKQTEDECAITLKSMKAWTCPTSCKHVPSRSVRSLQHLEICNALIFECLNSSTSLTLIQNGKIDSNMFSRAF